MLNSSHIVNNFESIEENFVVGLPSNVDTFAILSFNDLDFSSSPCHDDNLMFSYPKLSQNVHTMDHDMRSYTGKTVEQSSPEGEDYFPSGSALADLSPGVEFADIDTFLRDPQSPVNFLNIDEVGLFLGDGLKDAQNLNSDVESIVGPLSTIETGVIDAAWLTNSIVISPNQQQLSGTDVVEDSCWFTGNPSAKPEEVCTDSFNHFEN